MAVAPKQLEIQSVRLLFYRDRNGDGDAIVEYILHRDEGFGFPPQVEASRYLPEDEPFDPGEEIRLIGPVTWQIKAPAFTVRKPPADEVTRLRGLLTRLEWAGQPVPRERIGTQPRCPVCRVTNSPHDRGCWLAAVLSREQRATPLSDSGCQQQP